LLDGHELGSIWARRSGVHWEGIHCLSRRIVLCAATSALAGLLFGFDTAVSSGVEQTNEELLRLSPTMHGIVMGSVLFGTVLGALFGC
jgi:hypothetical protein